MQHTVILSSLCKWKRQNVFVVKRYAVREAKKWRYAVRKAKNSGISTQGQNRAVRSNQRGRGCHPYCSAKFHDANLSVTVKGENSA